MREYDELHAISNPQLGEHVADVSLDRRFAEEEPRRDLGVAEPFGRGVEDESFALGEARERCWRVGMHACRRRGGTGGGQGYFDHRP